MKLSLKPVTRPREKIASGASLREAKNLKTVRSCPWLCENAKPNLISVENGRSQPHLLRFSS
jgi:hypothetical protein